jgi:hypothetical protein
MSIIPTHEGKKKKERDVKVMVVTEENIQGSKHKITGYSCKGK